SSRSDTTTLICIRVAARTSSIANTFPGSAIAKVRVSPLTAIGRISCRWHSAAGTREIAVRSTGYSVSSTKGRPACAARADATCASVSTPCSMSLRTDCSSSLQPPGMLSSASIGMTPRRMRISVNEVTVLPPKIRPLRDHDDTSVPAPPILRRDPKLPLIEGVSLYPTYGRGSWRLRDCRFAAPQPPRTPQPLAVGRARTTRDIVTRERVEVDEREVGIGVPALVSKQTVRVALRLRLLRRIHRHVAVGL